MTYKLDRVIQNHSWRQDAAATGATKPAPSWEQTKEDCVGPDLPADDPLYNRAAAAQALAKVTAERDQARQAYLDLSTNNPLRPTVNAIAERLGVCPAEPGPMLAEIDRLKDLADAHTVVSRRLIGAQKEVAEVTAQRDEIAAAHSTLHTESEARRRADLRAVKAFTTIAEVFGVDPADVGKVCEVVAAQRRRVPELERERDDATTRADRLAAQNDAAHEVIDDARCAPRMSALGLPLTLFDRASAVMQQRRRDDELREQIAVAVGLDDSASLALILDTVTRDRPGREISRLSGLLDVLAAPVAFGERRLSTVERVEWALRRWLAEGKECSARMAQLIEAEVYLDVLGVPAYAAVPSDDPGDASEALTVAERLRLYFAAR